MLVDDYSFPGACITIKSILNTSKKINFDFVIFTWNDLSEKNKNFLKMLYNGLIFKEVNQDDYKNCKFSSFPRKWNYNCAYRFEIFTLSQYKKILYIDCDFLVQKDLTILFNKKYLFGAVKASNDCLFQGKKTFNAGLLLIDNFFLKNTIKNSLISLNTSPGPLFNNSTDWISDEPILNSFFNSHVKFIDKKFNYLITSLKLEKNYNNINFHFNGDIKPWQSKIFIKIYNECFLKTFLENNGTRGLLILKKIFKKYESYLNLISIPIISL